MFLLLEDGSVSAEGGVDGVDSVSCFDSAGGDVGGVSMSCRTRLSCSGDIFVCDIVVARIRDSVKRLKIECCSLT